MALPTEKAAIKSITSVQVLNEKSYVKVGTNLFAEEVYKDLQLLFPSTLHSKLSVPPTEMCLLNELWFIPPTLHQPLHFCCPSGNQMWSTKTRLCGNKPCLLLWGPEKQLQKLWLSYSEVLVLQRIKTEEETYARMGYTAVKQKSMSSKEVLNHASWWKSFISVFQSLLSDSSLERKTQVFYRVTVFQMWILPWLSPSWCPICICLW